MRLHGLNKTLLTNINRRKYFTRLNYESADPVYMCVCVCVQAEALQGFLDEADSSVGLSVEKKASVIPRVRTWLTAVNQTYFFYVPSCSCLFPSCVSCVCVGPTADTTEALTPVLMSFHIQIQFYVPSKYQRISGEDPSTRPHVPQIFPPNLIHFLFHCSLQLGHVQPRQNVAKRLINQKQWCVEHPHVMQVMQLWQLRRPFFVLLLIG